MRSQQNTPQIGTFQPSPQTTRIASAYSSSEELRQHAPKKGSKPRNISRIEQWGSLAAGCALLLSGLKRGKWGGLIRCLAGGGLLYRGATGHCYTYEALGIDTAAHPDSTAVPAQQGVKIDRTIVVNRPVEELYNSWRDLENLPQILRHLVRVDVLDETRSHWVATGPMGTVFEWDAEIINQRQPELIAWKSLPGSRVETAGSVRFKPLSHDRGTSLSVSLKYNPPTGKLGASIASMFGQGMEQELDEDLRRFKNVMETGEVPTIQGPPQG